MRKNLGSIFCRNFQSLFGITVAGFRRYSSSLSSKLLLALRKDQGPLPAKCWPEAFHAHSFTSFRERGKTGQDGERSLGTTISTTKLPTTTTLTDEEVGGVKKGGRTSENSVTLSLMLIQISTSNVAWHYRPHAGP